MSKSVNLANFGRLQKAHLLELEKNKNSSMTHIVCTFNIYKSTVSIPKFQFYPYVRINPCLRSLCRLQDPQWTISIIQYTFYIVQFSKIQHIFFHLYSTFQRFSRCINKFPYSLPYLQKNGKIFASTGARMKLTQHTHFGDKLVSSGPSLKKTSWEQTRQ